MGRVWINSYLHLHWIAAPLHNLPFKNALSVLLKALGFLDYFSHFLLEINEEIFLYPTMQGLFGSLLLPCNFQVKNLLRLHSDFWPCFSILAPAAAVEA